jgi:hypothetical protein
MRNRPGSTGQGRPTHQPGTGNRLGNADAPLRRRRMPGLGRLQPFAGSSSNDCVESKLASRQGTLYGRIGWLSAGPLAGWQRCAEPALRFTAGSGRSGRAAFECPTATSRCLPWNSPQKAWFIIGAHRHRIAVHCFGRQRGQPRSGANPDATRSTILVMAYRRQSSSASAIIRRTCMINPLPAACRTRLPTRSISCEPLTDRRLRQMQASPRQ